MIGVPVGLLSYVVGITGTYIDICVVGGLAHIVRGQSMTVTRTIENYYIVLHVTHVHCRCAARTARGRRYEEALRRHSDN